jgi:hypothetical protein
MLTNSSLSIAQQRFNEWRWQREEADKEAKAKSESSKSNDGLGGDAPAEARPAKTSARRPPRG